MLALTVVAQLAWFAPRVSLGPSASVTLHGHGRPVVFSSGLYGTMPHQLYTDLFARLAPNVTLVVPHGLGVLDAPKVGRIARALRVDRLCLLAHSSFRADALEAPEVSHAILCDPIVMPDARFDGLGARTIATGADVLVVRAGEAYAGTETVSIPEYLTPEYATAPRVVDVPDVGHADLLDDRWAAMGPVMFPWMRTRAPTLDFASWAPDAPQTADDEVRARREAYHAQVATLVCEHVRRGA